MVILPNVLHEQICRHAADCYPEECCGLLLGIEKGDRRFVQEVMEVQNVAEDSRKNRYVVAPTDLLRADNLARERGWDILGTYHSHPDHEANPSEYDRQRAVLRYSYIILSMTAGLPGELNCWTLHDWDASFDPEEILVSG